MRAGPSLFLRTLSCGGRPWRASAALVLSVALLMVALAGHAGAQESLTAVRFWTAPDHTRIVIDMTGSVEYDAGTRRDPDRVVVLVKNASLDGPLEVTPVGDGLVERIRVNELEGGAQIVLDLTKASEYNVFPLLPYAGKPHRVVIDVFRDADPRIESARDVADRPLSHRVVVIDAGHGGEDPGTLGNGALREKDVVLDIARRLAAILGQQEGCEAKLTRDGDYYVSLRKRKELASAWDGDLFISIHANSAPNKRATGTEVFTVSDRGASDETARELADRENAADIVGGVTPETGDDVLAILVDLKMGDRIQKSAHLASFITGELTEDGLSPVHSKRAGFVVLKSLAMPSVLVEVGFLSSSKDVAKLKRSDYRQQYAEALAEAIEGYFTAYAPVAAAPDGTHEVAPGETLWSIARRYGRSVAELRNINNLPDDCTIYVGQKLSVSGT